ncbi:unnamed protein product [Boreogadus saida]
MSSSDWRDGVIRELLTIMGEKVMQSHLEKTLKGGSTGLESTNPSLSPLVRQGWSRLTRPPPLYLLVNPPLSPLPPGSTGLDSVSRQTNPGRLAELLSKSDGALSKHERHRAKRSVFLHSGVRICPKETLEQVLASHQAYYQLRVCQEAVWEAFRIFLDRIPGTVEYQRWVGVCQDEALCISDLGRNFSASEEHMDMIKRRMSRRPDGRQATRVIPTPAATLQVPLLTAGPQEESSPAPTAAPEVFSTTSGAGPTPEPELDPTQPPPTAPEDLLLEDLHLEDLLLEDLHLEDLHLEDLLLEALLLEDLLLEDLLLEDLLLEDLDLEDLLLEDLHLEALLLEDLHLEVLLLEDLPLEDLHLEDLHLEDLLLEALLLEDLLLEDLLLEDLDLEDLLLEDLHLEALLLEDLHLEDLLLEDLHLKDLLLEDLHLEDLHLEDLHLEGSILMSRGRVGLSGTLRSGVLRSLQDPELPNVVPERLVEREVGFSIDLVDPGYRELLDDPDSPQYIDLAHHLQDQVRVRALLAPPAGARTTTPLMGSDASWMLGSSGLNRV